MYARVSGDEQCVWCLKYMTHGIANIYMGKKFCEKKHAYAYSRIMRAPRGDAEQSAVALVTRLLLGLDHDDDPEPAAPAMVAA